MITREENRREYEWWRPIVDHSKDPVPDSSSDSKCHSDNDNYQDDPSNIPAWKGVLLHSIVIKKQAVIMHTELLPNDPEYHEQHDPPKPEKIISFKVRKEAIQFLSHYDK